MFVRIKTISGRRYAYLVEGVREGRRVRQKTLCYLGPLTRLYTRVPYEVVRKAAGLQVDWKRVNDEIRRIPLTPDELSEVRKAQYALYSGGPPPKIQRESHN